MRPICALLGALAFLSVAMFAAQAQLWDRAGSLDWQTFKVPEYGTCLEAQHAEACSPQQRAWAMCWWSASARPGW
jgi:hypothetical protein